MWLPKNAFSFTFRESKQAITLPFSTWQLLGANLHSSSEREQVPLWNCLQTSNASHFVSLTGHIQSHDEKITGILFLPAKWWNQSKFQWSLKLLLWKIPHVSLKVSDKLLNEVLNPGNRAEKIYRQAVTINQYAPLEDCGPHKSMLSVISDCKTPESPDPRRQNCF